MPLTLREEDFETMLTKPETGRLGWGLEPSVILEDKEHDLWLRFPSTEKKVAEKLFVFLQTLSDEEFEVVANKLRVKDPVVLGPRYRPRRDGRHRFGD